MQYFGYLQKVYAIGTTKFPYHLRTKIKKYLCVPISHLPSRVCLELCNDLTTFQRYMLFIFTDIVEELIEVFIDDFFVFDGSFNQYLPNLDMVLNLEKCLLW